MAKLRNRYRRFVIDGRPVVLGLSVPGDGALCTNPMYGRGCTTGSLHAWMHADNLASALSGHSYDPEALALSVDDATIREIVPFHRSSVRQDADGMHARLVALGREEPNDAQLSIRSLIRDGLLPATRTDAVVFRAFLRNFNLLEAPEVLMSNSDVVGRIMATWQARASRPPEPSLGPDRDEMLALLAAAAA